MRASKIIACGLVGGAILLALSTPSEKAAASRGRELFERRCSGCHASDIDKEGPRLRSVYGSKAGSVSGFNYSDALKKLKVRWDDESLDRWLSDPDAMAPDTDMGFKLVDREERKAIVIYLKSLAVR